jgi:hypothetical protein
MRDLVGHAPQSGHTVKGFVQADERFPGCPDNFPTVVREKHPGRTSPSGAAFLVEANQESRVRYHFRPPKRQPRPAAILSRMPQSISGGGFPA